VSIGRVPTPAPASGGYGKLPYAPTSTAWRGARVKGLQDPTQDPKGLGDLGVCTPAANLPFDPKTRKHYHWATPTQEVA